MAEVIPGMNLRNSAMIPSSNIPKAASSQETAKQQALKQTDTGSHMQADKTSFATNEKVNTKLNARDNIDKALNGYLSTSEQQTKTSNKPQNQLNTQKSQSFIAMQQMRGNALNKNTEGIKQAPTAETRGQQSANIKNEQTQLKNAEAAEKKSDSAKSVKTETAKTAVTNETKQQAVQAKNNNIQLKNTEAATKQAESIKNSEKAAEADSAKTARAAETALQQDLDKTKLTRTRKAYSKTLDTIKEKSAPKSSEETKDSAESRQTSKNTGLQKQNPQRTAISRIEQRVPEEQKNIKNTEAQKQSVKEQATAENQKGIERQNQAERKGETQTRNAIQSASIQKGAEAENKRNIEKQEQSEKRAAEKSETTSRQAESRSQNTPSRTAASNPATTAQHNQDRGPVRGSLSGSAGAMETPSRNIPQRGAEQPAGLGSVLTSIVSDMDKQQTVQQPREAETRTLSRNIPQRGAEQPAGLGSVLTSIVSDMNKQQTVQQPVTQIGSFLTSIISDTNKPQTLQQPNAAAGSSPTSVLPNLHHTQTLQQPNAAAGSSLTSVLPNLHHTQTLQQPNAATGSSPTSVLPNLHHTQTLQQPNAAAGSSPTSVLPNLHHTQTLQQPNATAGSFPTSVLPNINLNHTQAVQQPNAAAGSFPTSVLPNINLNKPQAVQQPSAAGVFQTSSRPNIQINGIIGGIMSQIASLPSIANSINPNNQVSQILARHNTSPHTAPLFRKPSMTIQSSLQSWNGPAAGKTANIYWKYPSYGHTDITNSWQRSDASFMPGNRWGWQTSPAMTAPHIYNKIQEGTSGSRVTSSVITSSPSRWTIKNAPIQNSVQKWHGHDSTITASSQNLRISSEFSAEKSVSRTQAGPASDIMLMSHLKDIKINRFSARTEAAAEPKAEYFKQNRIHGSDNSNDYMRPSSSLIKSNNSRGGTITIPSPSKTLEKEAVPAQPQSYRVETQGALSSGKSDIAEEYEQWASKDLASSSGASTKRKALNALRSRMMKNKGAKEIEEKKSEENDLKETKRQINAEKQADVRSASNTRASEAASKHSNHIREHAIKEEKYESDGTRKGKEDRDYAAIDYSGRSSASSGRDNKSNLSFSQQQKANNENSAKNARQSSEAEGKMPQAKAAQASDGRKNAPMMSAGASSMSGGNIPPHMLQGKAGQAPAFNSQYASILRDESLNMSQTSSAARARHEKAAISNVSTSLESTLKKSNKEIWSGDEVAAKLLFMLMKSSDKQVYEHSERVIDLSSELAIEMGIKDPQFLMELRQSAAFCDVGEIEFKLDSISEETRKELSAYFKEDEIKNSGFLHDIGNVFIPSQILNKRGKLTAEEYAIVKQHPETGEKMLKDIPGLAHTAPAVRHHHERWDGKGYPDAIGGEDIPYQARLIAVCDSFDAMVSDRPYRQGMSLDEALNEIQKGSGTQFDPIIANAFIQMAQKKYGIDR